MQAFLTPETPPMSTPQLPRLLAVLALALAMAPALAGARAEPLATRAADNRYIIELSPAAGDPQAVAGDMARQFGLLPGHIYRDALRGFSATIPADALDAVAADRRVRVVTPDVAVRLPLPRPEPMPQGRDFPVSGQTTPPGIARIQAPQNPVFMSGPVDVDVAVIDTGVWAQHPDLNVVGGKSCVSGEPNVDYHGHGTHVAGIIGAIDNDFGVVGVAPGARIWSVKVMDRDGAGTIGDIICGVDWVTAHARTIEVANMSLGMITFAKVDTRTCGRKTGDTLHEAICASVRAGVTYAVAAGNNCGNAQSFAPAAYPEVITVSAFTDTDGMPGGYGSPGVTRNCGVYGADGKLLNERQPLPNPDDAISAYTNTGKPVDLWAPGTNVLSTYIMDTHVSNRPYAVLSGTSMASPHVAGAAALELAADPSLTPEQVRSRLVSQAERRSLNNPYVDADWNGSRKPTYRASIVNVNPGAPWPPQP